MSLQSCKNDAFFLSFYVWLHHAMRGVLLLPAYIFTAQLKAHPNQLDPPNDQRQKLSARLLPESERKKICWV